jgi:hypothetical protein
MLLALLLAPALLGELKDHNFFRAKASPSGVLNLAAKGVGQILGKNSVKRLIVFHVIDSLERDVRCRVWDLERHHLAVCVCGKAE